VCATGGVGSQDRPLETMQIVADSVSCSSRDPHWVGARSRGEIGQKYKVAVLCVAGRSVYPDLAVECYDIQRDARTFKGGMPVVAHPPCGPWGKLSPFCTKQDATLGPFCVEQVRKYGGVLEHPAYSRLWDVCDIPRPGVWSDAWGGRSYLTSLSAFGARVRKLTWLYVVGASPGTFPRPELTEATVQNLSSSARQLTPIRMAHFLCDLAERAGRCGNEPS
jgi:hypothetical protein